MANYTWPKYKTATVLGGDVDRMDGLPKTTGAAKYSYDITPPKTLHARQLGAPHAHCKLTKIDVSAAAKVPGVVKALSLRDLTDPTKVECYWVGDPIAVVVGETEGAVAEGLKAIKVEYEPLDVFNDGEDIKGAEEAKRVDKAGGNVKLAKEAPDGEDEDEFVEKELARLFKESATVVDGYYGIDMITHSCLEPHGSTCVWDDGKLTAHLSTQNVSGTAGQFADPLKLTADDVTVHCDYIGGGFGSKFAADSWGVLCAQLARELGRPVKLMLSRAEEQQNGGNRPSAYIEVKAGADKTGRVIAWDSHSWGTSGVGGGGVAQGVIPYVFDPANRRRKVSGIRTNIAPSRAWRAPNHPQGCAITQTVYDDVARQLGLNSYDVFLANLPDVTNGLAKSYAAQMEIAAEKIGWKEKWHLHGKGPKKGSVVEGLGMAIHTWGGAGHNSSCLLKVHPDGGVEVLIGSQDIGTGTRTVIAMVVAETFGLKPDQIKVSMGSSKYPASGPSGGSTTVGGVSESSRRASEDALDKILAAAGKKLGVEPGELKVAGGKISAGDKSLSWKDACSLLGVNALEVRGEFLRGKTETKLTGSQVAGVQMAHVAVDTETGVVKMQSFVAVQDMGLVVNRKLAASQIYGSVIMGIAYSLFEQTLFDNANKGELLNAELDKYKLPRLGDIGEILVEFYEPESEYNRGIIGLGEPPVIGPGAAISNAVCNALGVRVPVMPLTPPRVLAALEKARKA